MYNTLLDQEKGELATSDVLLIAERPATDRPAVDDLQVCRRLDWRMLLAQPRLRRVAYVGQASGVLVEALKRFSESLTIFSSSDESFAASQSRRAFEVMVLRMPALRDIEMMRHLLKLGGSLYVELHRPRNVRIRRLQSKSTKALPALAEYVSMLERSGFNEIETYWHRPNFEQCREIIPLNDRVALEHVFTRRSAGFKNRLKLLLGRTAMRTGMLARFVTCVSIVARKSIVAKDPA